MTVAIPSVLSDARAVVDDAVREALSRLDDTNRRVCDYHFGFIDTDGFPACSTGKALRPALVLLASRAAGGQDRQVLPAAVAVELAHNFSLLHDDLMDGDTSRRHRPTAWTVFGRSAALLAGDALLTLAHHILLEHSAPAAPRAARLLAAAIGRLIVGQAADMDFEQRMDVTVEECLSMAEGKTAALMSCSTSMGALLAGAEPETVAALELFGTELGMAFQLVDDLLGLWGDPDVTGKPVLSDIRARKKSLPIVHALASQTQAGNRLAKLFTRPGQLSERELASAAELVETAGSHDWARAECERRLTAAHQALDQLAPGNGAVKELAELADFVVRRTS